MKVRPVKRSRAGKLSNLSGWYRLKLQWPGAACILTPPSVASSWNMRQMRKLDTYHVLSSAKSSISKPEHHLSGVAQLAHDGQQLALPRLSTRRGCHYECQLPGWMIQSCSSTGA